MACDDRQLTEAQRQAGYQNQRTGVQQALRPFQGSPTLPNLIDYVNRELGPAVRRTRDKVNEVYLPVVDNAPSGNPLGFYFSTNTANADPTTGRIRLNAATQDTATIIRVSETNRRLVDVIPWLDVMAGGATTPLGVVTLTDAGDPRRFIRFDLNTMVDQGTYWDLGVTPIESSHDNPFVDDGPVVISFIPGVSSAGTTIPPGSLTPMPSDTLVANVTGVTAAPTNVTFTSLANNSLSWDATNNRFDYIGSTSLINVAATGALGVVDISTLLAGGAVTLQPSGAFSIDGFTAKATGFWFDLIYRDNTSRIGTINDNAGATTTSIRCPGAVACTITKQESIRFKYYNARWRVVGISGRPLSLLFPGAPIYDVMASPFNAAGDGVTDDTAAINAAIAAANAVPGTIYLGQTHLITSTLTAIAANSVHVRGRGIFSSGTELKITAGSGMDAFLFSDARYCSISDIWIRATNAYQTGSSIKFDNCYKCRAERLLVSDFGWGVEILSSSLIHCEDIILSDLKGTEGIYCHGTALDESHAIRLVFIAGGTQYPNTVVGTHHAWLPSTAYVVGQVVTNGPGIYQATTSGTSAGSGGPTGTGTGITDGTVVWQLAMGATTWYHVGEYTATFDMTDCGALQGAYGIVVDGVDTSFLRVKNFQADHCFNGGVKLSSGTQHRLDQVFVTSIFDGNAIEIGSGVTGNWEFVGGNVFGIAGAGVSIQAGNGLLMGMQIVQCSTDVTNTRDGIEVAAGVEHFSIVGCSAGYGIGGTTPRMRYGLSIGAGCDNYVVTDNRFIDNQTGAILNTPGRATTRIVRDNIPDDTTAGNSLEFDAALDQYAYIGSLSTINITPTGAQGVVDISALLCGGSVTVQPGGAFDISGFTAKPQGFWFDLIYRDTTTHIGTLNENSGATTTSIRNPGNAAITFTTQEVVKFRYQLSRWRVVGRATRSFSLTDGDKGDITVTVSGATWTIDNDAVTTVKILNDAVTTAKILNANVTLPKLATQAADTVVANVTTGAASPTAVALSTLANNSLSYDATNHRYDYIGSTSAINLTPTGAQGVVNIAALLCGGSVTLQPSGAFDIDGFTAMPTGFWFDLIYRDTTTHIGTVNENAGNTSTSIRNPGNVASTFTTQEVLRFKYQNTRWRVAGRSVRGGALTDGDKGDITVSASGATWTIDNAVVTLAKMENRAQATFIGRAAAAGTGVPQELTAAQAATILGLSFTAVLQINFSRLPDASISITPPAGATWFEIECLGGGGGGGGADADSVKQACAGGGGGAGGWFRHRLAITSGNITGAIGGGGTGGLQTGTNGGNGDDTFYNYDTSSHTAVGGLGGTGTAAGPNANAQVGFTTGGQGGSPSTSAHEYSRGGWGHAGMMFSVSANPIAANGGNGGASVMGSGGRGGQVNSDSGTETGASGQSLGSGGGGGARTSTGAASTGATGGGGLEGFMKVTFYSGPVPTNATIT